MELENTHNNALAKLPMLKLGEYEMWEIKITQYFQIQDYALWEKRQCKKNDVRLRSLLLMALPNEHQLTFDQYVDAQSMFAAIKARFGGNEATKKTHKALLKQYNTARYDKSKVECFNCHKMGHFARECRAPRSKDNRNWNQGSSTKAVKIKDASEKAMCAIDGAGFDWSDMAEAEIQANMALMAFSDSEEIDLLKRSVVSKEYELGLIRTELEKVKQEKEGVDFKIAKFDKSAKDLNEMLESQITDKSKKGVGYHAVPSPIPLILIDPTPVTYLFKIVKTKSNNSKENTDDSLEQHQMTDSETSSFESPLKVEKDWKEKFFYPANHVSDDEDEVESHVVKTDIPTAAKIEKPVRKPVRYAEMYSCPNQQRKRIVSGNNYNKKDNDYYSKTSNPSAHKHMAPRAVLMKTGLKSFNTARPVNTVRSVNTGRPFSTARPFRSTVNIVRARGFNAVKPSTCWVWRPIKPNGASLSNSQLNDKGFVDSGCLRHMTGNIAHLSDFKDFDGGYVTFGGGAYGGRITGKSERKNRTLIEAARTVLVDSNLPTTFWAEAVSTACYVQNRVLIVKPHNKTPYELFRGFKPAIGFMKPFGCHVTILNTLDNLGKFDGKSDEENKPIIEGNDPKWLFDIDSLTQSMNYVPVVVGIFSNDFAGIQGVSKSSASSQQDQDNQDCIVMPIWKDASYFGDAAPRSVTDAQIQVKDGLRDENNATEKSHDDSSLKDNGTVVQQVNTSRPEINTGSREVSTTVPEVNTATPEDLVGPSHASQDTQVEDQEVELGNIPQSYAVPTTPHTRIHKDHPIEHVIGDVQSSVQIRRMKTSYSEQGFLSAIYEGKTHEDLHTCLFACFLSQEEPKRVSKALSDPAWVEAMQEELLQFKLQKVWILVDLPKGHSEIGTKWVYRNKKDERGIVIINKARLIAQGHTQEEGIDYDEVFAPVARIEAIRMFLAYASYMGFMVYQMDVKSSESIIWPASSTKSLISKKELCDEFEKLMKEKFQMSSMGELTFFLDVKSASIQRYGKAYWYKDGDAVDVDGQLIDQ
ncbi:putative ribonuclease H-like domain-containing protein [Tanacetum coccineum]